MKKIKKVIFGCTVLSISALGVGCGSKAADQVVIYSNADEEAIAIMEKALNLAGYEGQYIMQGMGTSEIGGKLLIEGKEIEADLLTMSTYYLESAQQVHEMFVPLGEDLPQTLEQHPDYYAPLLGNVGALFVNTQVLEEEGLTMPTSFMDLTKPEYAGLVAIPNIMDSSTGWLGVQAIADYYGETDGKKVLGQLLQNCGPHIESSGSGPIKKVRAGEVAAGFGLRHQAVADAKEGKPVAYVDPVEGNFTLTEAVAVVQKDEEKTARAQEMAKVIISKGRSELIKDYPVALYEGESVDAQDQPAYSKSFEKPLTVELLKAHQDFFNQAKPTL
ncbi:MAG: extracellular solute-binding protein [Cellulosilyticaceae bacterium]